jgi:penicillin-binding protein 1C
LKKLSHYFIAFKKPVAESKKTFRQRVPVFLKKTGIAVLIAAAVFLLLNLLFPLPPMPKLSTIITDDKGTVIHAFLTPDQQWRMKTTSDEISPLLKKTIIQKEDKYFYSHPGVNAIAVTRAMFANLFTSKRTSGASTITMQVARMLQPKKRNVFNKLIEMFRALQLELKYSKQEILEAYLNLVPYGGNIQGVKAASLLYFNKNPDHLSLAEITALSIIPNRPNSLVIGRNNELIVKERNKWLHRFAKEGVFTQKEIADALSEPLTATRGVVPKLAPHISFALKKQYPFLDIITTNIDFNRQLKTEKLVADYIRGLRLLNINNAAAIIISNKDHKVISYAGSANFYDTTDGGQVNGAAAIRQPGSTLKPLLYGLCIDNGLLTPKMTISDVAVNYQGYVPENYDQRFNGDVTMEYALEHSLNIPAVKMLNQLGKKNLIQALALCHFNQIKKDEQKLGLSMILGGCGTTLEELTGLFTVFANDGAYYKPHYLQTDTLSEKTKILSTASTFMLGEILSKITRPDFPINWQATEHLPKIAWKTGTSYGRRDAWSIGYNKDYTIGVWVGNFSGQGIPELSGAQTATPLLFKIFNSVNYNAGDSWFKQPAGCDIRMVCSETGLPPTEQCNNVVTDYFIPLVSPTYTCNNRQLLMVSEDESISYCVQCVPVNGYKKKWYKLTSPEIQQYNDEHHIAYEKIPPHNPNCQKIFTDGGPVISSPTNGTTYYISKLKPEPLMLQCNAAADVSKVYWYINNRFYKTAQAKEKLFFIPDAGLNKISCTDDKGRNRDIKITVSFVDF